MHKDLLHSAGLASLGEFLNGDGSGPDTLVRTWVESLKNYSIGDQPHEVYIWYTLVLALRSVAEGNYGVGSIIVVDDQLVAEGNNKLLAPYFRTDQHAEMNAISQFEEKFRDFTDRSRAILFTSLECCPMCTVRIINSGIRTVYYSGKDSQCGMLSRLENLPPFWTSMINKREPPQRFSRAECGKQLIAYSEDLFLSTEESLSNTVANIG